MSLLVVNIISDVAIRVNVLRKINWASVAAADDDAIWSFGYLTCLEKSRLI